jgi:hypothetical protein
LPFVEGLRCLSKGNLTKLASSNIVPLKRSACLGWAVTNDEAGCAAILAGECDDMPEAVFLLVPVEERLARLRARELIRHGHEAIAAGGRLHKAHVEFLDWAERYDDGGLNMRSRALHECWIQKLPLPVLRLDGNKPVDTLLDEIEAGATM